MMNNQKFIGAILIILGLLLTAPFLPKVLIFLLGIYIIFLGIRLLKTDMFNR
jgi:threonine/homoserine/homoserine lactone efflux protein